LPIIVGILAGLLFPYKALENASVSILLLCLLMIVNGSSLSVKELQEDLIRSKTEHAWFLFAYFIFIPVLFIGVSQLFIQDDGLRLGFALSCLAPVAFVSPYFSKIHSGRPVQATVGILLTTLLYPFVTWVYVRYVLVLDHYINITAFAILTLVITLLPMAIAAGLRSVVPKLLNPIVRNQGWLNSLLLALLMFVLCGSTYNKWRWSSGRSGDLLECLVLLILLDFAVLYLAAKWKAQSSQAERATFAIALSMKNFAVPASLLLSLQPVAAMVPCIGLVVHVFLFQWLNQKDARSLTFLK
jgi:predicted Na+-dependent transporter